MGSLITVIFKSWNFSDLTVRAHQDRTFPLSDSIKAPPSQTLASNVPESHRVSKPVSECHRGGQWTFRSLKYSWELNMWTKHKYQYYQQKSNEELVKGTSLSWRRASLWVQSQIGQVLHGQDGASGGKKPGGVGTATLGTVTPWYMLWVGKVFKILLYPVLSILETYWGVLYGQAWPFLVTLPFQPWEKCVSCRCPVQFPTKSLYGLNFLLTD